jgi:hypothetical protein
VTWMLPPAWVSADLLRILSARDIRLMRLENQEPLLWAVSRQLYLDSPEASFQCSLVYLDEFGAGFVAQ